jgi:peptide/nickel transport system substrate-binding protein
VGVRLLAPLFDALKKARALPAASAVPAYQTINRQVMQFLPGVPLAHPTPSLAFGAGVHGYVPSPVQDEPWNAVTVG